jgi:hypothetical protein
MRCNALIPENPAPTMITSYSGRTVEEPVVVCAGRLESLGIETMAVEVYVFTIGVPNLTVREVGCIKRDQHKLSAAITRPALLVGHALS